jgi:hypothetical protein
MHLAGPAGLDPEEQTNACRGNGGKPIPQTRRVNRPGGRFISGKAPPSAIPQTTTIALPAVRAGRASLEPPAGLEPEAQTKACRVNVVNAGRNSVAPGLVLWRGSAFRPLPPTASLQTSTTTPVLRLLGIGSRDSRHASCRPRPLRPPRSQYLPARHPRRPRGRNRLPPARFELPRGLPFRSGPVPPPGRTAGGSRGPGVGLSHAITPPPPRPVPPRSLLPSPRASSHGS